MESLIRICDALDCELKDVVKLVKQRSNLSFENRYEQEVVINLNAVYGLGKSTAAIPLTLLSQAYRIGSNNQI